jgi:hypothetical protein
VVRPRVRLEAWTRARCQPPPTTKGLACGASHAGLDRHNVGRRAARQHQPVGAAPDGGQGVVRGRRSPVGQMRRGEHAHAAPAFSETDKGRWSPACLTSSRRFSARTRSACERLPDSLTGQVSVAREALAGSHAQVVGAAEQAGSAECATDAVPVAETEQRQHGQVAGPAHRRWPMIGANSDRARSTSQGAASSQSSGPAG